MLSIIIRKEFRERADLRRAVVRNRKKMFDYTREDYLFAKKVKTALVNNEISESRQRLSRKLEKLEMTNQPTREVAVTVNPTKERVSCIDTTITDAERQLLERGPKFVPSRKKPTEKELRTVETAIEEAINSLRWRKADEITQQVSTNHEIIASTDQREGNGEGARPSLLQEPKIQRLIKATYTQRGKQPPKMDPEEERQVTDLKVRIMRAYREYHPKEDNLTKEERSAFRTLKEKDVVIKCSDKSKSLVVMKNETYETKAKAILADDESYEVVDTSLEALNKKLTCAMKSLKSVKDLPKDLIRCLQPAPETHLPEFYGLPKIHKLNAPLRPVVAAFDAPMTPISIFLERILHQLLKFVPAHIQDTVAATRRLNEVLPRLEKTAQVIIVTMDVIGLYPSIPIEDGIRATVEKLKGHADNIDTAGVSIEDIEALLRLVLRNNYFKFGDTIYRQTKGVAMGNHLAPPLAIIFMDSLEQTMLQTAQVKPASYDRYVDDCLLVWTHGEGDLINFINHCNQQHPDIRFTWESTLDTGTVSFMDLDISIGGNHLLEYELHQKPSDSGVNLNYKSAIPKHVKLSVATEQFRRVDRLSSNPDAHRRGTEKIKILLRSNSYPEEAIDAAIERSRAPARRKRKLEATGLEKKDTTLRLPFYSDDLEKTVRRLVRKAKLPLMVSFSQATNVKEKLVRSALLPKTCAVRERFRNQQAQTKKVRGKPCNDCVSCQAGIQNGDCERRGTVYVLKCGICGDEYVGESQRALRTRLQEHVNQARNLKNETPWGEHMKKHANYRIGKEPIFAAKILATESSITARRSREAIEIRDRKPAINRNNGWSVS